MSESNVNFALSIKNDNDMHKFTFEVRTTNFRTHWTSNESFHYYHPLIQYDDTSLDAAIEKFKRIYYDNDGLSLDCSVKLYADSRLVASVTYFRRGSEWSKKFIAYPDDSTRF